MINRQNQLWSPAPRPDIEWREGIPRSRTFGDIYFSIEDGIAESRYVFIEGSGLPERVANCSTGNTLVVAETGFGTGLNFLLTLAHWQISASTGWLHYIGIDNWPLRIDDMVRACEARPELAHFARELLAVWPAATRGCHRIRLSHFRVTLDLWWEDAADALEDLASRGDAWVDLWYLDGFAPARDGGIWSSRVFDAMAALSRPAARFTTFTAAGDVRRGLAERGFQVTKRPGFGRKRDCLVGNFAADGGYLSRPHTVTPWDLLPRSPTAARSGTRSAPRSAPNMNPDTRHQGRQAPPESALVLGAGIAGASIARSLAERGISVRVLERQQIASGGSSNLQGLTYTRLSRRFAPLSDFALASYHYATRWYHQYFECSESAGGRCGYLQVSDDHQTLDHLLEVLRGEASPAQILDAKAASEYLGLPIDQRALFFPEAFWLNPPAVCKKLLNHPLIEIQEGLGDVVLEQADDHWLARTTNGGKFEGDIAILATAYGLLQHPWTNWLPLQGIRGQTTHLAATTESLKLKTAFCHEGYLPPASNGIHCLGASYGPNDLSLEERVEDHSSNIKLLADALPGLGLTENAAVGSDGYRGHVALRCTTADYLPVAGPVPDRTAFNSVYADLTKQKTRLVQTDCPVVDGLWILGGLGSRGLTAAPLAAELIASQIANEPPPLTRQLQQALSPARFLVRGLVRGAPL